MGPICCMKYQPWRNPNCWLNPAGKTACASSEWAASVTASQIVNVDNNRENFRPCFQPVSQGDGKLIIMYSGPCYHSTSLLWVPFNSLHGIVSYRKPQECTSDGSVIVFQTRRNDCLIWSALDMIYDSEQREIIIKCAWCYFITRKGDIKELLNIWGSCSVWEKIAGHWKENRRCFYITEGHRWLSGLLHHFTHNIPEEIQKSSISYYNCNVRHDKNPIKGFKDARDLNPNSNPWMFFHLFLCLFFEQCISEC